MKAWRRFGTFWYHFIIGDDWRIAVGVVLGFALIALLTHAVHWQVWWLLPLIAVTMLAVSLWEETRRR